MIFTSDAQRNHLIVSASEYPTGPFFLVFLCIGLRLKSHTQESEEPKHRPRIDWKADHQSPVHSHDDAIEKLDRYAISWKNETFHKILKSGCKAEEARLRTAESPRKPHCCLLHPGLAGGG